MPVIRCFLAALVATVPAHAASATDAGVDPRSHVQAVPHLQTVTDLRRTIDAIDIHLPADLPSPGLLASAETLGAALEAALPGFTAASDPAVARTRGEAIRMLLQGAEAAERLRAGSAPEGLGSSPATLRLLQHPFLPTDPGVPVRPRPGVADLASRVDLPGLRSAAAALVAAVDATRPALDPAGSECEGEPTPPVEQANGQVALDTAGTRTLYSKAYALTIDLGGCDVYRSLTAGADGGDGRPISIAIDTGDDPDLYEQPKETYALGGASEGVALLLDEGGDDVYRASGYASMGAGIVGGVGILADLAGDDRYEYVGAGGGFGAQGNATLGFGALLDLGGDDLYRFEFDPGDTSFGSRLLGTQGAGTVGAIGVLGDAGGSDVYRAITYGNTVTVEAQGVANFLWGSTGVLLDAGTEADKYTIEAHVSNAAGHASGAAEGQGVGVLDGVGLLVDGGGPDAYRISADAVGSSSGSAGAFGQGFGTAVLQYSGLGALLDTSGDDTYAADAAAEGADPERTHAVTFSQGHGFFLAGGLLADLDGSDTYRQGAEASGDVLTSGQGAGLGAAAGVLIDRAGADRYTAGSRSQGFGSTWPFFEDIALPAGTGLLLDGAGRNAFTGPGRDGAVWTQGVDGVGLGVDAGRAGLNGYDLVDGALFLFGLQRPHPVVTSSVTAPGQGAVLHGDIVMTGTADGGPATLDWVEWRADVGPWALAEPSAGSWAAWRADIDVDALAEGEHVLRARAWADGLDSEAATVPIVVERWIPTWDVERAGDEVNLAFDLLTRAGAPVDEPSVAVRVLDEAGEVVALFADGLAKGGGRYATGWAPPSPGTYTVLAEVGGQLLGATTVTV